MSTQPTPFQISLVGVAYSDQRRVFSSLLSGHEADMESGNHLRWFFSPELGFPDELRLYRVDAKENGAINSLGWLDATSINGLNTIVSNSILPNAWGDPIASFRFSPFEGCEAFYQKGDPNRQIPNEYQHLTNEINQRLESHCNPQNAIPLVLRRFGDQLNEKTTIKEFHAFTLASLDPYIARLMGMYYIDKDGELAVYKAVADYGSRSYPLIDYNIHRSSVERLNFSTFKIEDCTIFAAIGHAEVLGHPTAEDEKCLIAAPVGNQIMLCLNLEKAVEEVHLYLRGQSPPASINVIYPNGNRETCPIINHQLVISPDPALSGAFASLVIIIEGYDRVYIRSIAFKSKKGPIGALHSNVSVVYVNNTPQPPNFYVRNSLPKLEITKLSQTAMPPVFDRQGRLNSRLSSVKIAHTVKEPSDSGSVLFYGHAPNPVRYVVGRRNEISGESPDAFLDVTHPGIITEPDPTFQGLLAYFDFQKKNFTNRANQQKAEVFGVFEYGLPVFRAIDLVRKDLFEFPTFTKQQYVLLRGIEPQLHPFNQGFTLGATVYPMQMGGDTEMTIFDYNRHSSLWLGLADKGGWLAVRVVINGQTFESTQPILRLATQPPRRLMVVYNEAQVKIYIDHFEEAFDAPLGSLRANPAGMMAIGADVHTNAPQNPQNLFWGHINDLHFWAKPMQPHVVRDAFTKHRSKLNEQEVDNLYTRNPFSWSDNFLPDGGYTYRLKGIDIFGRIDREWSTPAHSLVVEARQSLPTPPQSVQARFVIPSGRIASAQEITQVENNQEIKTWTIEIADLPDAADIHSVIAGHDMYFVQTKKLLKNWMEKYSPRVDQEEAQGVDQGEDNPDYQIKQLIQIGSASFNNNVLQLTNCELPPFPQIRPAANDPVVIPVDKIATVEWQWTGLQQVYNPDVAAFELYHLPGGRNQIETVVDYVDNLAQGSFRIRLTEGAYTFSPDAFAGRKCDINNRQYTITNHDGGNAPTLQVEYSGEPIIVPERGDRLYISLYETDQGYQDLNNPSVWGNPIFTQRENLDLGPVSKEGRIEIEQLTEDAVRALCHTDDPNPLLRLDWINPKAPLWELRISGLQKPNSYKAPEPQTFVPGALVAAVRQNTPPEVAYEVFYTLWHDWNDDNVLRLYANIGRAATKTAGMQPSDPDSLIEVPKIVTTPALLHVYFGKRFSHPYTLPAWEWLPGQTTQMQRFTVRACTADGRKSTLASPATLVAVDRRKPPKPAMPEIVSFGKADDNNLSEVVIRWQVASGVQYYNVYRATDADIFAADLENRRLQRGSYAGIPLEEILEGDTGRDHFRAFRHKQRAAFDEKLSGDWSSLQESDLFVTDKQSTAWKQASYFWNYWAAWYYPTLDNAGIKALAEKEGNESAFTLVNSSPISILGQYYDHQRAGYYKMYTDQVNGAVNNRYYYRLRSMGQNLAQSTQWGNVSLGEKAETPAVPPRTPVFTKVEAGDRQVTLQWALNREPDLKGYVLYRSRQKELLDDLRWFEAESPNGNALVQRTEIPDPRIVVRNERIVISDETPIQSIVGVYRAEEYDFSLGVREEQLEAVNFWGASGSFRRMAGRYELNLGGDLGDGAEVVIVVLDSIGIHKVLKYSHSRYPFVDEGLLGLTTYYYQLAAQNEKGGGSKAGEVQSAKALEIEPPAAPVIISSVRVEGIHHDTIRLEIVCEPNLEIMVQQKKLGALSWETVLHWSDQNMPFLFETNISKQETYSVKVWSRTRNQLVCNYPNIIHHSNTN